MKKLCYYCYIKCILVALTGLPIGYSAIVALTGLPIGYSVIVTLTGLPIGYGVIVALTGLPTGYGVIGASLSEPHASENSVMDHATRIKNHKKTESPTLVRVCNRPYVT